jgi:hypothetical protein
MWTLDTMANGVAKHFLQNISDTKHCKNPRGMAFFQQFVRLAG